MLVYLEKADNISDAGWDQDIFSEVNGKKYPKGMCALHLSHGQEQQHLEASATDHWHQFYANK